MTGVNTTAASMLSEGTMPHNSQNVFQKPAPSDNGHPSDIQIAVRRFMDAQDAARKGKP